MSVGAQNSTLSHTERRPTRARNRRYAPAARRPWSAQRGARAGEPQLTQQSVLIALQLASATRLWRAHGLENDVRLCAVEPVPLTRTFALAVSDPEPSSGVRRRSSRSAAHVARRSRVRTDLRRTRDRDRLRSRADRGHAELTIHRPSGWPRDDRGAEPTPTTRWRIPSSCARSSPKWSMSSGGGQATVAGAGRRPSAGLSPASGP